MAMEFSQFLLDQRIFLFYFSFFKIIFILDRELHRAPAKLRDREFIQTAVPNNNSHSVTETMDIGLRHSSR
jgi:hypothetical protein